MWKTTSTVNIGAGLPSPGKEVLIIDIDPQTHPTVHLGINSDELDRSVYDLLTGKMKRQDVTREKPD